MINKFTRSFIGLILFGCMCSCNQGEAYYQFRQIPQNEWSKNQELFFTLDSVTINPKHNYALSIEISHNIVYSYKNLFLYIDHTLQDSILVRDTLECMLVDDLGKWYGSGNGATRQLSVLYKTNQKIDTALHNEVIIRHAMQDLKLKGIEKVGLKIY